MLFAVGQVNLLGYKIKRQLVLALFSKFQFSIFQSTPIISSQSREWIFGQFHQLFDRLGNQHFIDDAQLILPTANFFPANVNSAEQMASVTFGQIKQYAGMADWPIDISPHLSEKPLPKLEFRHGYHGSKVMVTGDYSDNNRIEINLDITKFPKAETLVATLGQQLGSILLAYTGIESSKQEYVAMTELLATFLGFGVMLANTSYQFRGGCGSCYKSAANRQTGLSEEEMIYSLAVFCQLKGVANKEVLPHLKGYMRPVYKKSVRDIIKNADEFALLQARL